MENENVPLKEQIIDMMHKMKATEKSIAHNRNRHLKDRQATIKGQ